MFIFLLILTIVTFILLSVVSAIRPTRSDLSVFELEHRSEMGDRDAKRDLAREKLLDDVMSLQRVFVALLLVIVVLLCVVTFDWLIGVLVAILVAFEYGAIANFGFIRNLSQKLYQRLENVLLRLVPKIPLFFKIIRNVSPDDNIHNQRLGSSAELRHLVAISDDVLTPDEKKLIVHGLSFSNQLVSEVMTPRDKIGSINKSEFLGPLTLDDLHKVGHSRLPVINGDIDHVVGILYLKNLLTLDVKRSMTAEKAMEPGAHYIRHDQTLSHALAAFLHTHHHLFIVVNESRETVGLITMNDAIQALLGRKIIDEFDTHDNLRAVSLRKKV